MVGNQLFLLDTETEKDCRCSARHELSLSSKHVMGIENANVGFVVTFAFALISDIHFSGRDKLAFVPLSQPTRF